MTPADTAKNEAAKQAVAMAFAVTGCVLLVFLQRKMGGGLLGAVESEADRVDPTGAQRRRMDAARKAENRWDRVTVWMWRFGPWRAAQAAHRRAQAARRAYEAERP